jgi:hypothetical protein
MADQCGEKFGPEKWFYFCELAKGHDGPHDRKARPAPPLAYDAARARIEAERDQDEFWRACMAACLANDDGAETAAELADAALAEAVRRGRV